jgi:hypothetical protein
MNLTLTFLPVAFLALFFALFGALTVRPALRAKASPLLRVAHTK